MDWKVVLAAPLVALLMAANASDLVRPNGWSSGSTGLSPRSYAIGVDPQVAWQGQRSVSVQSREAVSEIDHGAAIQYARGYRGKRVRFSGWLKVDQVKTWAGTFLNVDRDGTERFFGSRHAQLTVQQLPFGEGLVGSSGDWVPVSAVTDVPDTPDATVALGLVLLGQGQAWLSGLRFEVVGLDVPVTTGRIGMDVAAYGKAQVREHTTPGGGTVFQPPANLALE